MQESNSATPIFKLLDEPLDKKHVTQREQSGIKLDYVEGWYIIDRLNRVFGPTGWGKQVVSIDRVQSEQYKNSIGKELWKVGIMAHVRLTVVCDTNLVKEDYGFGNGIDADLGKAHESAVKEAVTDALKRCAKDLGMSMGLALYDKSKANVAVAPKTAPAGAAEPEPSPPVTGMTAPKAAAAEFLKVIGVTTNAEAAQIAAKFAEVTIHKGWKFSDFIAKLLALNDAARPKTVLELIESFNDPFLLE